MDDLRNLLKAEGATFTPAEEEALRHVRRRHRRRQLARRGGLIALALAVAGIGPYLFYEEIAGGPGILAGGTPPSTKLSLSPSVRQTASHAPSPSPSPSGRPADQPSVDPKAKLRLGPGGIGAAPFGANAEEVIKVLSAKLGPPGFDTGWKDLICFVPGGRIVVWGSLATFYRNDEGSASFVGYRYGGRLISGMTYDNLDLELSGGPDLRTAAGIVLGSTDAEVRAAYPSAQFYPADPPYATEPWYEYPRQSLGSNRLILAMDRAYPNGKVIQIGGGDTLDCGGE
jgi:hypothetical protein